MKVFFRNALIILGLFTAILYGINTYSLSVTHREFLYSMRNNPEHAYFYITPQAKEKVTIEDMSSYLELANSLDQIDYNKPQLALVRKRRTTVDLTSMDRERRKKGNINITYVFERGRWVVADLDLNDQSPVAIE